MGMASSTGESVKLGFEMHGVTLRLSDILPSRKAGDKTKRSRKYETVIASVREVGIIEPPVVHPLGSGPNIKYLLLDGHMRIEVLKELGQETVFCLISTDDETYSYNKRINSITPIQEHFMILNAINRGVREEKIASALNVDVGRIREKRNLLDKICPEAIELLKDASAGAATIRKLRIVKPARQVEIIEMMDMVNNYSAIYCEALIAATPKEKLTEDGKAKKNPKLSTDDIARMEREMETLQRDMQMREDNYGRNFLDLVIVRGYLSKLLGNGRVVRYFSNNHSDLLEAFQQIVESTSLEG
jgi:hypothetical protein